MPKVIKLNQAIPLTEASLKVKEVLTVVVATDLLTVDVATDQLTVDAVMELTVDVVTELTVAVEMDHLTVDVATTAIGKNPANSLKKILPVTRKS